jgi:ABC-type antimicrobial peptide transport system permease subunit
MIELLGNSAPSADFCVRMKSEMTQEEMDNFLSSINNQLTENNLFVSQASPVSQRRELMISGNERKTKIKLSLTGFMLVNVFFGIIGTFWLRTQSRRSEIGLRVALGSSRRSLYRYMTTEGLILLVLTLPIILIFVGNLALAGLLPTDRLPFVFWRFAAAGGAAYLLLVVMIWLGIRIPARRAARIAPADALHDE